VENSARDAQRESRFIGKLDPEIQPVVQDLAWNARSTKQLDTGLIVRYRNANSVPRVGSGPFPFLRQFRFGSHSPWNTIEATRKPARDRLYRVAPPPPVSK
jgi:hypothetical protein